MLTSAFNGGIIIVNAENKPFTPRTIWGQATHFQNRDTDDTLIIVKAIGRPGEKRTYVKQGYWQVDVGWPGLNWPFGTDFIVIAVLDGLTGISNGTIKDSQTRVDVELSPQGMMTFMNAYPVIVYENESIEFSGTVINGNHPYSWYWDFGDGSTSTEPNPTHQYGSIGEYKVELQVTDDSRSVASDMITIAVIDFLHIDAEDIVDSQLVHVGEPVIFTGSVSGGLKPYFYQWGIEDNIFHDRNLSYTFPKSGIYDIAFLVTDSLGKTAYTFLEIMVEAGALAFEFLDVTKTEKALVKIKTYDEPAECVVTVNGNIWYGGSSSFIIPEQSTKLIKPPISIGFGKVIIRMTINDVSSRYTAFLLGPFFLNLQEK
jgi:PKD repeat protein